MVRLFPTRTGGPFDLYLFADDPSDVQIKIESDSTKSVLFEKNYAAVKDTILPLDITGQPEGTYNILVSTEKQTVKRRVRVRPKP